ncbi:hypothetical protein Rsub_10258 [Raphidocelis subcapitata]|uniref:Uncharacterized protein n=1 Tax=Raphidocelis subcapitata TaxID=307507 RepID=A0A2V0PIW5_9CHLO|nr:hypothetical protein Rsub_10258 [Raphidocelis subcapitata]|eukprot:GBF97903.1 hypothetical protein Rsub_10258 [Raphidocelis subcapitata]
MPSAISNWWQHSPAAPAAPRARPPAAPRAEAAKPATTPAPQPAQNCAHTAASALGISPLGVFWGCIADVGPC